MGVRAPLTIAISGNEFDIGVEGQAGCLSKRTSLAASGERGKWSGYPLTSLRSDLQALAALLPFLAVEDSGASLDQPRQHLKDRHRRPDPALAGAEAATVQLVGDTRVGAVLDGEFHDLKEHLALRRVLFQVRAVAGHLQAEGNLRSDGGLYGTFDRDEALPLYGKQLPSFGKTLIEVFRPKKA